MVARLHLNDEVIVGIGHYRDPAGLGHISGMKE